MLLSKKKDISIYNNKTYKDNIQDVNNYKPNSLNKIKNELSHNIINKELSSWIKLVMKY